MRLGVVSDSHGHVDCTRPAIRMLESLLGSLVLMQRKKLLNPINIPCVASDRAFSIAKKLECF